MEPKYDPNLQNAYILSADSIVDPNIEYHDRNHPVIQVLLDLAHWNNIIVISGREEKYRPSVESWLTRYMRGIEGDKLWDTLFMRLTGDAREAMIVEQEIYEYRIMGIYNVLGVFVDHLRGARLWGCFNLPVFYVGKQ